MSHVYKNLETAVIHAGISKDPFTKSVNVPIYQSSTFGQDNIRGQIEWEYARTGNPTRFALEELIKDLEQGYKGFAFASGMAAISAVLTLFKTGDKLVLSSNVYGGTYRLLDKVLSHVGIKYELVDTTDLEAIKKAITPEVKAIYIETPTNPLLDITDIKAVSALAKEHGLLTIVDNTFMTPYLQRPLTLGADIVLHSATKYLGGHSDLVAGLVVVNNADLAQKLAFIQNSVGAVLGPFDSFLLIRGIKTLAVRLDRHTDNALKIALDLTLNKAVTKVYYPRLKSHPGFEINQKQAKNGGAMISFLLDDKHDVRKFYASLKLITLAESLGGVESLVCHPASMTHAAIPEEIRNHIGIKENLIRFSVGIENYEDLKADLEQAIENSRI